MTTELPHHIGPYQVTDLLGQGATSRVFRATLPLLGDQAYAVKLLRVRCTPREIRGFLGECTKVKRLGTHPHIVQVHFAGLDRRLSRYYVAVELVQGPTAMQVLAQAPGHQLPLKQALQIGIQVGTALEHAHQRGILHLDVKPSNILCQAEGNLAKLTDFGSARLQEEVADFSLFPSAGTPAYQPWEQTPAGRQAGSLPDQRSDLYSLAATLYHLLTGHLPLASDGGQIPSPLDWRPDLPPALVALLLRALSRDARERPATVYEFRRALEYLLAPQRVSTWAPLPTLSTGLIGHEPLLRLLKARLLAGENPVLCALEGLPGVGKTALAAAFARDPEVQEHFTEGILWGGLGPKPDLLSLLSAWGDALGLSPARMASLSSIEAWSAALRQAIGQRRLLLVIDDAWTVESALACQVGGPACAHLLTTRSPETALQFAGTGTIRVPELDEGDGRRLLAHLAPDVITDEPEAAAQLVHAVGGLPLALVLMGRYLQAEAAYQQPRRLQEALAHVQRTTERIRLERPVAPADHPPGMPTGAPLSLATSIGVSYRSLQPGTRRLLLALSAFPPKPATFSEEAALAVARCTTAALDELSDTGLLESSGPGRYTLHQTIADFARSQPQHSRARERFALYYVDYTVRHQHDFPALDQEAPLIFPALETAFSRQMMAAAVRGVKTIAPFLEARAMYPVAERLFARAREAARSQGDAGSEIELLVRWGWAAILQGHYAQAEDTLLEGWSLAGQSPENEQSGALLQALGALAEKRGEYAQAETYLLEGLRIARDRQQQRQITALLNSLGMVANEQGDRARARRYLEEGLALARQSGDGERLSALLVNLGIVVSQQGDLAQEEAYYQEALRLARRIGHLGLVRIILCDLGVMAEDRGDLEQAEAYLQESLAITRQAGNREMLGLVLSNLGELSRQVGKYAQAEQYLEEGLEIAHQVGHRQIVGLVLTELGALAGARGQHDQSEHYFAEALSVAREIDNQRLHLYVLNERGALSLAEERWAEAQVLFSSLLEQSRGEDRKKYMALALFGQARVDAARGNQEEAKERARASLELFEHIGALGKAADVSSWLARLPEVATDEEPSFPPTPPRSPLA